jgi:hypothetical protein
MNVTKTTYANGAVSVTPENIEVKIKGQSIEKVENLTINDSELDTKIVELSQPSTNTQ